MSETSHTPTLYAAELRWRPLVLAAHAGSYLAVLAAGFPALTSDTPAPAQLVALLAAGALVASNQLYLASHSGRTTVGMAPVSVGALGAAAGVALLQSPPLPLPLRMMFGAIVGATAILAATMLLWFVRIRSAYRTHPHIAPDAALVVLGGAIRNGRPCATLAASLDVAARHWHESEARTIVVTGGPAPGQGMTEAQSMARYLQEHGVNHNSILLEQEALNTQQNIAHSCQLLHEQGFTGQLCVVSSDYHLWRARRDARVQGIELTGIAAPTPWMGRLQQWSREALTIMSGR